MPDGVGRSAHYSGRFVFKREARCGKACLTIGRRCDICHQHGNGHWSYPSGHRADGTRNRHTLLKIDITDQPCLIVAGALCLDAVDPDIDHRRTGFDPVALDHFGSPDSADKKIGLPAKSGKVFGSAMGRRNGCIGCQKQSGHGLAEQI